MPSFNNLESALNFLKKNTKDSMKRVMQNKIEEILKDFILKNQYNWKPDDYVRTYQYINCITVGEVQETSKGYTVELFFDTDKITPDLAPSGSSWNRHMDKKGNDVKEFIPLWLEEGTKYPSSYPRKGNHAIKDTIKFCKDNGIHVEEMIKELERHGIKAN